MAAKVCKVQVGDHIFKALKGDYEIKAEQQSIFFNLCKTDHADEQCHGKHGSYAIAKKGVKCYNLGGDGQKPEFSLLDEAEPSKGYKAVISGGDRTAICPSGSQRSIEVEMQCDPTRKSFEFECDHPSCEEPKCHYKVKVKSSRACPPGADNWGDTFLMGFIGAAVVYLGGGVFYNHKQKGLRGMDAIPNIEFWQSLPGLVSDGIAWTKEQIQNILSRGGYSSFSRL